MLKIKKKRPENKRVTQSSYICILNSACKFDLMSEGYIRSKKIQKKVTGIMVVEKLPYEVKLNRRRPLILKKT